MVLNTQSYMWDGLDGYLLGPTLRAPYGANNNRYAKCRKEALRQKLNVGIFLPIRRENWSESDHSAIASARRPLFLKSFYL